MPARRSYSFRYLLMIALLIIAVPAYADGIDLFWYFTRVSNTGSPVRIISLICLLMAANYTLNFIVIGFPACRYGSKSLKQIAVGLIVLTIFGQVADRIGALLAAIIAAPVSSILGLKGEGNWLLPLIVFNFLFSGAAVAGLVLYFLRRRWDVQGKPSWFIAVVAAILTNPAWTMGTIFIR